MTDSNGLPPGYWPARIALLSLRAALPKRTRPSMDSYRLRPASPVLTADGAARLLAGMSKPLGLVGEVRDAVVEIACWPVLDPDQLRRRAWRAGGRHLDRGVVGHLVTKRYGLSADTVRVVWIGRGEQLIVSLADVAEFYRDYECTPYDGGAADWVDSQFARVHGVTPASAADAVAVIKIFPFDSGWMVAIQLPGWLGRFFHRRTMRRLQGSRSA